MSSRSGIVLEACVTGIDEARASVASGADRLELCRDLAVGGLTPPPELVRAVLSVVRIPVFAMVRPTAGPFRATATEIDAMGRSITELRSAGVAGIVLGLLSRSNRVDRSALAELCAAASPLPVTFHRAFDETPDLDGALETIAQAGAARVLTGGGPGSAWANRDRLARVVDLAGDRLSVVAAGRVRGGHVRELIAATGVSEVHARASAIDALGRALNTDSG